MIKTFILDTNVLLHDPQSIFKFEDNHVVIPVKVIEEVDRFKRDQTEIGRSARQVSRYLDGLRKRGGLAQGIPLDGGGRLQVSLGDGNMDGMPPSLRERTPDNLILSFALLLNRQVVDQPVVFVSKDINLRIKADALGIASEDYESDTIDFDELYTGIAERTVTGEIIDRFYASGRLAAAEVDGDGLAPNQYVSLKAADAPSKAALGRYAHQEKVVLPLLRRRDPLWGIVPRNREQQFALDLLLDDRVKLATLVGKAGTGKTLLALAAGLFKSADEATFKRLLVSRPIVPLGRDIGFLPGDIRDKLRPWMQPILDNVELLLSGARVKKDKGEFFSSGYEELVNMGILEIEALTYIRGRSIPNQFMIIDEAQNLTAHEVKTIITRVGEGSKIVLTGDPYQIDNPYVDASSNGLTYVVDRFRDQAAAGHVTLAKGERSSLAELAANIL